MVLYWKSYLNWKLMCALKRDLTKNVWLWARYVWLNTWSKLDYILRNISFFSENFLKKHYPEIHSYLKGIVSIDKIPKKLKKCQFVIINQSLSTHSGSHWLILTRDIEGCHELFDSLVKFICTGLIYSQYLIDIYDIDFHPQRLWILRFKYIIK